MEECWGASWVVPWPVLLVVQQLWEKLRETGWVAVWGRRLVVPWQDTFPIFRLSRMRKKRQFRIRWHLFLSTIPSPSTCLVFQIR